MTYLRIRPALLAVAASAAFAVACRDTTGATVPSAPSSASIVGRLECTGNVRLGTMECREHVEPGSVSRAIVGSAGVKLRSSNLVIDSVAHIVAFDVTLQNLLAEPIGTPDGSTITGSKAFFATGPTVTAYNAPGDTGTVTVDNPDGYGNFTAAHQPYFLYPQILQPGQISPALRWKLRMPATVYSFAFTLYVFTARPSETPTPASAPDSLPSTLYAPENSATDLAGMTGTYLRDVVTLQFKAGATPEDRQAAISWIGGRVIGGVPSPGGEGVYYVRVRADSTAATLLNALDLLRTLPQVEGASPEFLMPADGGLDYSLADDSADYDHWKIQPDSVAGSNLNWGLEAIDAPLAWGCETGSADTKVAVVDHAYFLAENPDLSANVAEQHQLFRFTNQAAAHGTEVASVLAARGNNGHAMTGVMWTASLALYESATDAWGRPVYDAAHNARLVSGNIHRSIYDAAYYGARVINVSQGIKWDTAAVVRIRTGHATAADERRLREHVSALRFRIQNMRSLGRYPLIVFSAGNDSLEARWNAYPQLAAEYPDQVLVVGAAEYASNHGGLAGAPFRRWSASNYGALVEIAAPSIHTGALDGFGLLRPHTGGTSFAAPFVTGVAGLLFSFDPRLTTAQVKQILIASAARAGRVIDNGLGNAPVPVVNAYEALKMAAERPGAPLCGTRVWGQGSGAMALRDSATGRTEALFGGGPVWEVNPLHGGKRVIVTSGDDYMYHAYRWNNGTWQLEQPDTVKDNMPRGSGAAMQGWWGYSHGQDSSVVSTNTGTTDSTATYTLEFRAGSTTWKTVTFDRFRLAKNTSYCAHHFDGPSALPTDSDRLAAYETWKQAYGYNSDACDARTGVFEAYRLPTADMAVYSSAGDRVYVVTNYEASNGVLQPAYSCSDRIRLNAGADTFFMDINYTCRDQMVETHSDGRSTYAYGIRHQEETWLPSWNEALANIRYWAVNEMGTEWTAEYEEKSHHMWFGWVYSSQDQRYHWLIDESDTYSCKTRFQNLLTGQVVHEVSTCGDWSTAQRSGYSPVRAEGHGSHDTIRSPSRRELRNGEVIGHNGAVWRIVRR